MNHDIPQPHSLWRCKYNHSTVYVVDYCDRFNVHYRLFCKDHCRHPFKLDLDAWRVQYEELSGDEVTIETGIY
ncbi:MAG: hypothetical protein NTW85_06565 [Methylococcales bacterium]|nr:hypothetical protein [Methylococcales bacterium]